jgi:hypothetical protein
MAWETPEGMERLKRLAKKGVCSASLLDRSPAEIKRAIEIELANRAKKFPSIGFVPNYGQVKAMKCLEAPVESSGDYPMTMVMTGGNGAGKTTIPAAVVLAGVCLGPEFVNPDFCSHYQFFHDMKAKRQSGKGIKVRIVCDGEDMSEGGSFYEGIREWVPCATFHGKKGTHYSQVKIGDVTIDVKTFQQDIRAHAGPNLDLILMNEPCPQDVWNENIGRLRRGGYMMAFLTPLRGSGYLFDVINDEDADPANLFHYEMSIWDNCEDLNGLKSRLAAEWLTPQLALCEGEEAKGAARERFEKRIERLGIPSYADEVETNGVLKAQKIIALIDSWYANNPDEVPARRDGKFIHVTGTIFKQFDAAVHVIEPVKLGDDWVFMQTCDPHLAKQPFAMWTAQTPWNDIYVIAEYPNQRWDSIKGTSLDIKDVCFEMGMIEQGIDPKYPYMNGCDVMARYGDPNFFLGSLPNSRETLRKHYADCGFDYETAGVIDDVLYGHKVIHGFLNYNRDVPLSALNKPRLYVFEGCVNTRLAFQRYAYLESKGVVSDKPDPKWKCIIDNVRYRLSICKPYEELQYELRRSKFRAVSAGDAGGVQQVAMINPALAGFGGR